jgi:hypothetical protein
VTEEREGSRSVRDQVRVWLLALTWCWGVLWCQALQRSVSGDLGIIFFVFEFCEILGIRPLLIDKYHPHSQNAIPL